ncbi:hypothetical protein [Pantoea sp. BAV 3049]|uniref:hypothetical protein n=1 Tax=Pantoea sp. BAV 3049 TaxID=2654188 RepID=UPI00131EAB8F|nr:hypothetical protein [Pantoea sp. BAV 3049]
MGSVADVWQTIVSTIVAGIFLFWLKVLHSAIGELRRENIRMRELYQLKSDAVRDQEQIMAMLSEIKSSMERTTERIDRLIGGGGR